MVLLVTSRFLSCPDSLLTFSPFRMNLEKMEPETFICLPAVVFVSYVSSLIALSQSFNHASNLSTPRSRGILQKRNKEKSECSLPELDWGPHGIRSKTAVYFLFQNGGWLYFISVTQQKNGCSGSLKWDSQLHPVRHLLSLQPRDTHILVHLFWLFFPHVSCWNTMNINRPVMAFENDIRNLACRVKVLSLARSHTDAPLESSREMILKWLSYLFQDT